MINCKTRKNIDSMSISYRVDDDPLPIQSTKNVNVETYSIK